MIKITVLCALLHTGEPLCIYIDTMEQCGDVTSALYAPVFTATSCEEIEISSYAAPLDSPKPIARPVETLQ